MKRMSSDEIKHIVPDAEPVRRHGDRRVNDLTVADDRRRSDRRDIPGLSALIRTLFRRGTGTKS